jgi:Asp-tRNA(Asn)/Glu-tRNA(Gln) amidotransferase A subunit family amidase
MASYDPKTFRGTTYHDAAKDFAEGRSTPRAYLERCLETIAERDGTVKAWVTYSAELGREAADASTERWKAGRPLSPIDGMPIGIKDLLETKDFPTEMGCEAFKGNFPKRDNAAVWALREAGAIILGKVTTAELGGSHPPATTNPFDPARTAGGSSSGSAAAVGAGMVPAAIGSQVGGSIIRPAAYCGNFALKPTQGAINRGERMATSQSTHGPHAASLEDMWQVGIEIAKRAGGDRGCMPLSGPDLPPDPVKPARVIVLETEGWAEIDDSTRSAFETLMERLATTGVKLIRRGDHPLVEALERSIADGRRIAGTITAFENRWMQSNLVRTHGNMVSERARAIVAKAEKMTVAEYQALLMERHVAQQRHMAVAGVADAMITLSCPGPAPLWSGDRPGEPLAPRPTGDFVFNAGSSMLFAPAVTMPLMSVGGMPVGAQFIGQQHDDAKITGFARWMTGAIEPVAA